MRCNSEAASGNVVEYHVGGVYTVSSNVEIVLHTFEGVGGVQKSLTRKLPTIYTKGKLDKDMNVDTSRLCADCECSELVPLKKRLLSVIGV